MDPSVMAHGGELLNPIFYQKVHKRPDLALIIEIYDQQATGSAQKSCLWLRPQVDGKLLRNRTSRNLDDRDRRVKEWSNAQSRREAVLPAIPGEAETGQGN